MTALLAALPGFFAPPVLAAVLMVTRRARGGDEDSFPKTWALWAGICALFCAAVWQWPSAAGAAVSVLAACVLLVPLRGARA